jgi:hypothetical protein
MKRKLPITLLLVTTIMSFEMNSQVTQPPATSQSSEFKPSGKIWGYTFVDYFYQIHSDSLKRGNTQFAKTPKDYNAFAFRRVYLGYDFNISEKFSTELIISHEGDTLNSSARTFFLKAANLRWKNILPNNDLVIGQTSTPTFSFTAEKVWGYRSIEKNIVDMRKLGSSNDVGLLWQGKLDDKGSFGYNLMIGNGTAQKPEFDKYKKFYGEVYSKLLNQKLILDLTADYEASSGDKSKSTLHGMVAYTTEPFTVGFEAVTQNLKNALVDTTAGIGNSKNVNSTPLGISIFARGQIVPEKLAYFARYDNYNPDTKYKSTIRYKKSPATYNENFITAGLDWMPVKNVHLEPNIWINTYSDKKSNVNGLAKNDYDMTARITFYYIFK